MNHKNPGKMCYAVCGEEERPESGGKKKGASLNEAPCFFMSILIYFSQLAFA